MGRGRIAAACLLGVGCHQQYSLAEVPIVGGTAKQVAAVEAELAHIMTSMDVEDLGLAAIRIRPLDMKSAWGTYTGASRRIDLAPRLNEAQLQVTVRHEVCHAMDHQLGLHAGRRGGMYRVAEWVDASMTTGSRARHADFVREEAFALVCEQGVHGARALLEPCQGLSPAVVDEIAWTLDQVALGPEPDIPAAVRVEELDVSRLGPWRAEVNDSNDLLLHGAEGALLVRPDGTVETEPTDWSGNIAQPWDDGASFDVEALTGKVLASRESASGRVAVIGTLLGAQHPALFVRDADGRWAHRACAKGTSTVMWDMDQNVLMGWASKDQDVLRIEVLP